MGLHNEYDEDGPKHDIDWFRIHPDRDVGTFSNDIAVIKLKDRLKYTRKIRPICIGRQSGKVRAGQKVAAMKNENVKVMKMEKGSVMKNDNGKILKNENRTVMKNEIGNVMKNDNEKVLKIENGEPMKELRVKLKSKPYDAKKSCWVPNKGTGGYDEGLIQSSDGKKITVKLLESGDVSSYES